MEMNPFWANADAASKVWGVFALRGLFWREHNRVS